MCAPGGPNGRVLIFAQALMQPAFVEVLAIEELRSDLPASLPRRRAGRAGAR